MRLRMRLWLAIAAINGLLAVAAGAFGAHALQARLDAHALQTFETGARYQMYHALAIGLAAFAMRESGAASAAQIAAALFLIGIVLFSGSLYALALTGARAFAFVTPVGGAAFLAGWAALAFAAIRIPR
jgi:uncharacterized membrane protein YgdD (TMEM256/DUF423 family)